MNKQTNIRNAVSQVLLAVLALFAVTATADCLKYYWQACPNNYIAHRTNQFGQFDYFCTDSSSTPHHTPVANGETGYPSVSTYYQPCVTWCEELSGDPLAPVDFADEHPRYGSSLSGTPCTGSGT